MKMQFMQPYRVSDKTDLLRLQILVIISPIVLISSILEGYEFYGVVLWLSFVFSKYLSKTSKYYDMSDIALRDWSDHLVTSNFSYFLPSIYAVFVGEYHMGFLCIITFLGSTIYHRNREAKYFNLDQIFATSFLATYGWSLYLSYSVNQAYFMFGFIGIPVAIFLLVYCGMPAEILMLRETLSAPFCCIRSERPMYNSIHALWHVVSGCGPLLSVYLFSCLSYQHSLRVPVDGVMIMGSLLYFDTYRCFPVVPTVAILSGMTIMYSYIHVCTRGHHVLLDLLIH
jgi:hypothetical protein